MPNLYHLTEILRIYSGVPNISAARLLNFGKLLLPKDITILTPTYTFISYYIAVSKLPILLLNFRKLPLPILLFWPTLILGTQEYPKSSSKFS